VCECHCMQLEPGLHSLQQSCCCHQGPGCTHQPAAAPPPPLCSISIGSIRTCVTNKKPTAHHTWHSRGRFSWNQGCCWIWGRVMRWAGSLTSMRLSRSWQALDRGTSAGSWYSAFKMSCRGTVQHGQQGEHAEVARTGSATQIAGCVVQEVGRGGRLCMPTCVHAPPKAAGQGTSTGQAEALDRHPH